MKSTVTLACVTILAVAGCSNQPTGSFEKDGTRVFESYGQSGNVTKKVTIPSGTISLRLKMDCINNSGDIKVEAAGTGWGDFPCGEESNSQGYIGLSRDKGKPFNTAQTIKVTAPAGATWSVAVDALETPLD